jgi:NAD(P)H-dependent flavin oxidoreductase YrpB (nitropropane dioxygenase family)
MSLSTAFTESMSIEHPIALAPMGNVAGGGLAAAVSNGGGLGLVAGGREDREGMKRELAIVTAGTDKPWGVGFLTWAIDFDTITWVLDQRPHAVMLSFGDPGPFAPRVRAAGVVPAGNLIRAGQAACSYWCKMPPRRSRRRTRSRAIWSGSVSGVGSGYSGRALARPW